MGHFFNHLLVFEVIIDLYFAFYFGLLYLEKLTHYVFSELFSPKILDQISDSLLVRSITGIPADMGTKRKQNYYSISITITPGISIR